MQDSRTDTAAAGHGPVTEGSSTQTPNLAAKHIFSKSILDPKEQEECCAWGWINKNNESQMLSALTRKAPLGGATEISWDRVWSGTTRFVTTRYETVLTDDDHDQYRLVIEVPRVYNTTDGPDPEQDPDRRMRIKSLMSSKAAEAMVRMMAKLLTPFSEAGQVDVRMVRTWALRAMCALQDTDFTPSGFDRAITELKDDPSSSQVEWKDDTGSIDRTSLVTVGVAQLQLDFVPSFDFTPADCKVFEPPENWREIAEEWDKPRSSGKQVASRFAYVADQYFPRRFERRNNDTQTRPHTPQPGSSHA